MNKNEFIKVFWKQYLLLEREFIQTDSYVSIDKDNYHTFSNNYLKLLLAICSEMDSLAELFCSKIYADKAPFGIIKKLELIIKKYPKLQNYKVDTKFPYDIKNITPLVKFSSEKTSEWWQAYNDVKHRRVDTNESGRYNYTKANLKNALYSIAALFILNRLLFEELEGEVSGERMDSSLFENEFKL